MKNTRSLFTLFVLALSLGACTAFQPPGPHTQTQGVFPGETYQVAKRENAYSLAQRMKVRMSDIIALNNLKPPYLLQPGQTITLPAKDGYAAPTPTSAPMDYIDKGYMRPSSPSVSPIESSELGSAPSSGKSIAGVGGVASTPLEPISVTPSSSAPSPSVPFSSAKTTYTDTPKSLPPIEPPAGTIENEAVNSQIPPSEMSSAQPAAGDSAPHMAQAEADMQAEIQAELEGRGTSGMAAASSSDPIFGWPVRGTIISTYGPKGKGRDNDGINIGAPKGSPVKAAEGGVVVYAGNEMKGFGNLVLIRHSGNWVTAYAHMDRLTVTKGKSLAKGDMIGTVGATGGVSTPQLHFEVRRSGAPVDPEILMK